MAGSVITIATVAIAANRIFKEFIPSPSICFQERIYAQGEYYPQLVIPRTLRGILDKDSLHFEQASMWMDGATHSWKDK
jgi:hypothetical protein